MPLTNTEIAKFAHVAVEHGAVPTYDATPERKAKLLAESKRAALSYYEQAKSDIQDSGFRITRRVKSVLWAELEWIAAEVQEKSPGE